MTTAVASRPKAAKAPTATPGTLIRTTCIGPEQAVQVPSWVRDLESFRRWTVSAEFPENAKVFYLHGEIWMDLTMEQLFTHNGIKTAASSTLFPLAQANDFGLYFSDGVQLSNTSADLASGPDGLFVATATLLAGRVRLIAGKKAGFVEVEGSPDMALEVVSESSEKKDFETLRELYWQAGIKEYWLIDGRDDPSVFDILRRAAKGYVSTRKKDGWVKSAVFGKAFKLTRAVGKHGLLKFTLEVK